jgi:hypothetical protein
MSDLRKVHFNQEGMRMLIGSVSSLAPTATVLNPVLAPKPTSVQATDPNALPQLDTASTSADTTTTSASHASAPSKTASGGSAHAAAAPVTASSIVDSIASGYSTTVAGTQYLASLDQAGTEYTASVASVLGATATESSELAAENNLNLRINELV